MPTFLLRRLVGPGRSLSKSRWSHCCTLTSMESNTRSCQTKPWICLVMPAVSPSVMFLTWHGRKFEVLYLKLPEEAQHGAHSSFCTTHDAVEHLHQRFPLFVLQPQCKHANSEGILLHGSKTFMPHSTHVSVEVAGPVPRLLEKCYPKGVKPLLLILEHIEVAHPSGWEADGCKAGKIPR